MIGRSTQIIEKAHNRKKGRFPDWENGQIVDEAEVHRTVYFPQKVILRHHLFHDHQLHLLLLLSPLLEHLFHRLIFFLVVLMCLYST